MDAIEKLTVLFQEVWKRYRAVLKYLTVSMTIETIETQDYKPCASAISKHNWGNITHEGKFKKKPEWGDFWNFKKNSH